MLLKLQNHASLDAELALDIYSKHLFFLLFFKAFAEIGIVFWEVQQYSSNELCLRQPMLQTRFCSRKKKNRRELRTVVAFKKKKKMCACFCCWFWKKGRITVYLQSTPNNGYSTDLKTESWLLRLRRSLWQRKHKSTQKLRDAPVFNQICAAENP